MDLRASWSPEALEDVESIASFIARDSGSYAKAVVNKLIEAFRSLRNHPERGRVVPELGDKDVREIFIYSY